MNSAELITSLSQKLQWPKAVAGKRLEDLVTVITNELSKSNSISLSNFGALEIKKREERISVHPVSGKRMLTPPKLIVKFKAAGSIKEKVKDMKL
jgi:nucleoid DNA-binding protein